MEAWRAYLELALGLTEASRKKAQKAAKKLVGKGGATAGQLQAMAEELVATSVANREALTKLVRFEVDRALGKVGLATADEVADLTARVRELEEELRTAKPAPADAPSAPISPTPAKKAVAKKTVAKKAAAPGAAEPAAPPAKKTAPAKKAVATVNNAAPESGPAAAAAPVDSPAAPAKKTVAKKAVAKKTVAKKAPARKTSPAKKAAPPPAGDA
jgi:polyhydroxyalkanoate synthesis regulator phasin